MVKQLHISQSAPQEQDSSLIGTVWLTEATVIYLG